MPNLTINNYFDKIRSLLKAKGIMIYNGKAAYKLSIAGWPHRRISADNDNGAKP